MAAANSKIDLRSELFLMFMLLYTSDRALVSPTISTGAKFPSWKIVYGIRCSIAENEKAGRVGFPRLEMEADIAHLWHRLHPRLLDALPCPSLSSSSLIFSYRQSAEVDFPVPKPLIVSRLNQERKPKSALSRSSLYCPSEARRNTNGTSVPLL
jgi:hypothetical protein